MYIGLLEDNPAVCEYMSTVLELAGHQVKTHTTGRSLLETLASPPQTSNSPYDMVILDLNLPGELSGQDVLKIIRSTASISHLPILIISGTGEHELKHLRTRFPTVPILRKPFKFRALIQSINQCCYTSPPTHSSASL